MAQNNLRTGTIITSKNGNKGVILSTGSIAWVRACKSRAQFGENKDKYIVSVNATYFDRKTKEYKTSNFYSSVDLLNIANLAKEVVQETEDAEFKECVTDRDVKVNNKEVTEMEA